MKSGNRGFTLIELMIAMFLMVMVTATCVMVFKESLRGFSKATGSAEVNQQWRVAMEKINQDLNGCLSMSSGMQRFLLYSQYVPNEEWGKDFPSDYLSFTTTTRYQGSLQTAIVTYSLVYTWDNNNVQKSTLWRYVQGFNPPGGGSGTLAIEREALCEGCPMFRVEYAWKDPREEANSPVLPDLPSNTYNKHIMDPGMILNMHPEINNKIMDLENTYKAGGLNGKNLLQHEDGINGVVHAGPSAALVSKEYLEFLSSNGMNFEIVFYDSASQTLQTYPLKDFINSNQSPGYMKVSDGSFQEAIGSETKNLGNYLKFIFILSPNLINDSSGTVPLEATDDPLDITANFSNMIGGGVAGLAKGTEPPYEVAKGWGNYFIDNSDTTNHTELKLWPTYVPPQLRVTMKVENNTHTALITRSKLFTVPTSGS
jgi:prepilin-type N-terminal cleavage/methylation domain-containing protein